MADINNETLVSKLTNIADGFRTSRSLTEKLSLDEMAELAAVPVGGESKLVPIINGTVTEITLADLQGATRIPKYFCNQNHNLVSVEIPDTVTTFIGENGFYNCDYMTNIVLSNNLKTIEKNAFYGCYRLTSMIIPASVTNIAQGALTIGSPIISTKGTLYFLSPTPPTVHASFISTYYIDKIVVPAGSGEAYKTATNWANYADLIEEATV